MSCPIDEYVSREDGIIQTPVEELHDFKGVGDAFYQSLKKYGDRVFQIEAETGKTDTYSSVLTRSIRTALEMKSRGIKPKDVICICSHNHLNSCVPYIATQFLGAILAGLDSRLSIQATSHLIKDVRPKMVFVSKEAEGLIEKALESSGVIGCEVVVFGRSEKFSDIEEFLKEKDGEDSFEPFVPQSFAETAQIIFSSGTTGLPKGICQGHYTMLRKIGLPHIDVNLLFFTFYAVTSSYFFCETIFGGHTRVVAKGFDPHRVWDYIDQYQVTFINISPCIAMDLIKAGESKNSDAKSLKIFTTVGTPISSRVFSDLQKSFPHTHVSQIYGQTETGGIATNSLKNLDVDKDIETKKPLSVGRLCRGMTCKIVHPSTEETLSFNQPGELRVKTKSIMLGYYNGNATECFDSDGWFKTGDIMSYDEDFDFYVVNRIKEVMKYRSWQVFPAVIEDILRKHPSVKDCVVLGKPHDVDGEHPMALVVLNEGESVSEKVVEEYVNEKVDDLHQLRGGVKFVEKLLYTPTGKLQRIAMRNLAIKGQM